MKKYQFIVCFFFASILLTGCSDKKNITPLDSISGLDIQFEKISDIKIFRFVFVGRIKSILVVKCEKVKNIQAFGDVNVDECSDKLPHLVGEECEEVLGFVKSTIGGLCFYKKELDCDIFLNSERNTMIVVHYPK